MIIKVPIYVELGEMSNVGNLAEFTQLLGKFFTEVLEITYQEELTKILEDATETDITSFKLLTRDQAIDRLRTMK